MSIKNNSEFIKTTLYIHKRLHDSAKMMAVLAHTSMSHIMCVALREKIENMQGKNKNGVQDDAKKL